MKVKIGFDDSGLVTLEITELQWSYVGLPELAAEIAWTLLAVVPPDETWANTWKDGHRADKAIVYEVSSFHELVVKLLRRCWLLNDSETRFTKTLAQYGQVP